MGTTAGRLAAKLKLQAQVYHDVSDLFALMARNAAARGDYGEAAWDIARAGFYDDLGDKYDVAGAAADVAYHAGL